MRERERERAREREKKREKPFLRSEMLKQQILFIVFLLKAIAFK